MAEETMVPSPPAAAGAAKRAFLSHSSADDRYVKELEQLLRSLGYTDIFNDGDTITPDEEFWPRIEKGIRECDPFVIVLSHNSVKSPWVQKEADLARSLGIKVIPIRIDDCNLPPAFNTRDVIELRQGRGDKVKIAPSRILRHSPPKLFGREKWLDALDAAWADKDGVNVYTLVAWGGVGKTSLVAHWVANRMPKDVERYFDWSFYSQGTGDSRQTSSDLFINEALKFFGDPDPVKGSPWERGERLAGLIRQHRTLLVLDGIEPLQYPVNDPQGGRLKDQGLEALLQSLAQDNPGLCVITTREHLKNIDCFAQAHEKKLDKLIKEAAIALLRHLQIAGSEEEMEAAWKDAGGHALTLNLLGRFLADAHGGDIRLRSQVNFEEIDAEQQGRSAFKVMMAYEKWLQSAGLERQRELAILRLTGLFDRPISPGCLSALREKPAIPGITDAIAGLKDAQWNVAINRLLEIDLVSQPETDNAVKGKYQPKLAVDAHPLIREYFSKQMIVLQLDAFKAAHSRLFDYLCKNTEHQPATLEGLQPLFQALVHGCLSARQQEACYDIFLDRILHGTGSSGFYCTNKLGAIGTNLAAVAAFFDNPWSQISSNLEQNTQAWLLNEAASSLGALGRLTEALEPMRTGLKMRINQNDWNNSARSAINLCELQVTLGLLLEAVDDGRRSIEFANKIQSDWQLFVFTRSSLAYVLFQSSPCDEVQHLFEIAEERQNERHPEQKWLYSVGGFRYCELLMITYERDAWRKLLARNMSAFTDLPSNVEHRAGVALNISTRNHWLLSIALDRLTLARVGVYRSIHAGKSEPKTAVQVAAAINGLREAGRIDHLPSGLLTAALYHHITDDHDSSERYLREAQQIAERGPMPLYLADVHLHRARMFRDKDDLEKAAKLIRDLSYGRRYEELADAEEAAKGW